MLGFALLFLWLFCARTEGLQDQSPGCVSSENQNTMKFVLRSSRKRTGSMVAQLHLEHDRFDLGMTNPVAVTLQQDTTSGEGGKVSILADIVAPLSSTDSPVPPVISIIERWVVPGMGSYSLHTQVASWHDAKHACEKEQAHLAIINSEAEAKELLDIFKRFPNIQDVDYMNNQAYIGASDLGTEGKFITVLGQSLEESGYAKWAKGEPNNSNDNEDCVTLMRNGILNDVPCNVPLAFFCEQPEDKASNKAPGTSN